MKDQDQFIDLCFDPNHFLSPVLLKNWSHFEINFEHLPRSELDFVVFSCCGASKSRCDAFLFFFSKFLKENQ